MATSGDRTQHFPAIERKHGQPIAVFIEQLRELGEDAKYPEQIAYLRENHGFSQAHANALVMYVRGSTTSKRFATPDALFASLDPAAAQTAREIFAAVTEVHPELELVVAWNQPMLRTDEGKYVLGISTTSTYLLLAPWSTDVLGQFAERLADHDVNKKTFAVPFGWDVDVQLLRDMVDARLAELR